MLQLIKENIFKTDTFIDQEDWNECANESRAGFSTAEGSQLNVPEYEVYLHLKTELEEHRMWKPIWLITNNSNKN